MKTVRTALVLGSTMAAIAGACVPMTANAAEARFEIRAYVPERCGSTLSVDPVSGNPTGLSCNFNAALQVQTRDIVVETSYLTPAVMASSPIAAGWQESFFTADRDLPFANLPVAAPVRPTRVRVFEVSL